MRRIILTDLIHMSYCALVVSLFAGMYQLENTLEQVRTELLCSSKTESLGNENRDSQCRWRTNMPKCISLKSLLLLIRGKQICSVIIHLRKHRELGLIHVLVREVSPCCPVNGILEHIQCDQRVWVPSYNRSSNYDMSVDCDCQRLFLVIHY